MATNLLEEQNSSSTSSSPSFEDCLKLLRGERDEQRLAGLLLVTKFCSKDDHNSIRRVYDAIGIRFLDRLLRTGMAKGVAVGGNIDNQDAYLQLSVTVLSAFCRLPEIAASKDMVSKIPLMLEIMTKQSASPVLEDCYEFLLLVSTSSEDGAINLFESGGLKVIARQMPDLSDGSCKLETSVRLVLVVLSKISLDNIVDEYATELSIMVASIAGQFELLQNALKFELLHLLSVILSSHHSVPLSNSIRTISNGYWPSSIRSGVMDILQNRVAPDQKMQALIIADSMISLLGEGWLIGQAKLPEMQSSTQSDRCVLLVLESSRIEVAVLLNDLAYLKHESKAEGISVKQRKLAILYSLVEKIIKLISELDEDEGGIISEPTLMKVISGLNETVGVVLEYLEDAKEHGQKKGDDLLASVRVIGCYLAETPFACKDKVNELLAYMLSVEGEDEHSPFFSICFLLPMICQTTMKIEGSKVLASSESYKAVAECLVKLVGPGHSAEDENCIFLACDTILNLLLKREQIRIQLDESVLVHLLKALTSWADGNDDLPMIMMASSICSLILDGLSEESLLRNPEFDSGALNHLSQLIVKSLATCGQETFNDAKSDADLHEIITAGYSRWADRFPHIRSAVEGGGSCSGQNFSFTHG